MKNIFILLAISLITLTACNKKEQPTTRFVSASIGNFTFYASGNFVTKHQNTTNPNLQIEAFMVRGNTIKLSISDFTGRLETFQLDGTACSASYLGPTPSVELPSVHGQLVILTVTPDITGTFHFTCSDSTVVDGKFNVAP